MTESWMSPELVEGLALEWGGRLVTWRAGDGCTATGNVYSVGAGRYARVAALEAPGVRFDHVPTIAELTEAAAAIDDLAGAVEPRSLADQIALVAPPA